MAINVRYLNNETSLYKYFTSEEDAKSTMDLLQFFSPYGPFKRNYSYFGPGGILQMYASFTENYNVDFVLNRLFGLSNLNTDFDKSLNVGGKGLHLDQAFISSMSEMAERLFGSLAYLNVKDKILHGTYKELNSPQCNCLHPNELSLFAKEQYENSEIQYEPFTEDSSVGWVEGKRLFSKESIWVPAQIVLLFYMLKKNESSIGYSTSGGLASNINFKETVYRGITELIERDAVNIRWTSNIPPLPIILDKKFELKEFNTYKNKAEKVNGEFEFYYHTLDYNVPVVSVVQIMSSFKRYAFIAGGGVDVEAEKAMMSAFKEYGQSLEPILFSLMSPNTSYSKGMRNMLEVSPDADIKKIDHFFKIMSYYGYEERLKDLNTYLNGKETILLSKISKDNPKQSNKYEYLENILKEKGVDPICFDFTPIQMKNNKIIKVMIPELAPPYLHSKPFWGHKRYYELPKRFGYTTRDLTYKELNKKAVPYP